MTYTARPREEPARGGAGTTADDGSAEVRRRLRGQVLPEMQSILEAVQEGTNLHERLTLVVANLADAETRLAARQDDSDTARYDMYDGDTGDEDWDEDDARQAGPREGTDGDYHGEGAGGDHHQRRSAEWRPEGPGRWTRTTNLGRKGAQHTLTTLEGEAAQANNGAHTTRGVGERTGATEGTAGARNGDGSTQGEGDREGAEAPRSGKHRRCQTDAEREEEERKASDAKRAQELHAQLERATAAQQQSYQEGTGGFGSEVALSWAAQKFVLDVQRAQAQASEMGIEPRASDGRSLLELSPMELKQWVELHLEDGRMED